VAAAACVCVFISGTHNMADMCFVIVSTTSSLLAYKGRLSSPMPPQKQHSGLKDTLARSTDTNGTAQTDGIIIYHNRSTPPTHTHTHTHSPFDDDDGHMEYLFLEKRHSGQSAKKHTEYLKKDIKRFRYMHYK